MRFRVGARTDVGRVREGNEDSYTVHEPLFAVADGMGGHQGGEVASNLALAALEQVADEPRPDGDSAPRLAELVREANRIVLQKANSDPSLSGMGTTLTAVLAGEGSRIHVAHVGDSRAYLLRGTELTQLTRDQTVVQRLVDEGRITPEEAEIHPQRSILTNALGVDRDIDVDEASYELMLGDRLLLCSDGLSGMVSEQDIRRVLQENEDPQAACDALVEAANGAGGQDNITALIIDAVDEREAPSGPVVAAPPTVTPERGSAAATADGPPPPPVPPSDVPAAAATPPAQPMGPPAGAGQPPAGPPPVQAPPGEPAAVQAPVPGQPTADIDAYVTERRTSWVRRLLLWVLLPLILVTAALFAVKRFYIDNQWFVGVQDDHVALFQGVPAEPLGFELYSVVVEYPDLQGGQVSGLRPEWSTLPDGITAETREDAETLVDEMQAAVEAEEQREQTEQGDQGGNDQGLDQGS